jgi:hypothetical protein
MQGNYIKLVDETIMRVENILNDIREIECANIGGTCLHKISFDNISFVPLTHEVLDKCQQFDKKDNFIFVYEDSFKFRWLSSYNYFYVTTLANTDYITKIEFVHELQNFIASVRKSTELIVNF